MCQGCCSWLLLALTSHELSMPTESDIVAAGAGGPWFAGWEHFSPPPKQPSAKQRWIRRPASSQSDSFLRHLYSCQHLPSTYNWGCRKHLPVSSKRMKLSRPGDQFFVPLCFVLSTIQYQT